MNLLKGKKCLITGASRGIGRATALAYAKEGAILYLAARSVDLLKEVSKECLAAGAEAVEVFYMNAENEEQVAGVANKLLGDSYNNYGVDVLVNNAGVLNLLNCLNGDVSAIKNTVTVNLNTPIILTRLLSPKMKERSNGCIVNIGSIAGIDSWEGGGLYGATKYGIRGWSNYCFKTLKPYNVKVFLINPGYVATEMVSTIATGIDLQKVIMPEDIAELALLPLRLSQYCCPEEVTVRVTGNPADKPPTISSANN